jgi:hypothetical protein
MHLFEHDTLHLEIVKHIKPAVAELKTVVYHQ